MYSGSCISPKVFGRISSGLIHTVCNTHSLIFTASAFWSILLHSSSSSILFCLVRRHISKCVYNFLNLNFVVDFLFVSRCSPSTPEMHRVQWPFHIGNDRHQIEHYPLACRLYNVYIEDYTLTMFGYNYHSYDYKHKPCTRHVAFEHQLNALSIHSVAIAASCQTSSWHYHSSLAIGRRNIVGYRRAS